MLLTICLWQYFMAMVSLYTSRKCPKTGGFVMFSGDVERAYCHEMGQYDSFREGVFITTNIL